MKYLQDYIEAEQTELFNITGAFVAFSKKQYEEGAKEGIKYASLGGGFICPDDNVLILIEGLYDIHERGIKKDITENGIHGIIERELDNHEYCSTRDIEDTVRALEEYKDITEDMILATSRSKQYQDKIKKYR